MSFDSRPAPDRAGASKEVAQFDYVAVTVDKEAIENKVVLALAELIEYMNTTSEDLRFVDGCVAELVEKYAGDDGEVTLLLLDRLRDCQENYETGDRKMTLCLNMADADEGGPDLEVFEGLMQEVQQILSVGFSFSCPGKVPTKEELEMQARMDEVRSQWGQIRGF